LLRLRRSSGERVPLSGPPSSLGCPLRTCHCGPTRESLLHLLAVRRRGHPMASGLEVVGDRSVRRQKALGMPGRGEPLHTTLALTRGPMRVLTAVMPLAAALPRCCYFLVTLCLSHGEEIL